MAGGWTGDVVRSLILAAMIACLAMTFTSLVFPDDQYGVVAVLCGLASLEAFAASRIQRGGTPTSRLPFRAVELATVFLLLQLGADASDGRPPLQDGVPQFDLLAAALFVPVLLSWLVTTDVSRMLVRVGEVTGRGPLYVAPWQRLARRFFVGGLIISLAAALSQENVDRALNLPTRSSSGPVLNVLLYFLLGMLLLGHARFEVLTGRWRDRQRAVAGGVSASWVKYVVGLAAVAATLAFLASAADMTAPLSAARAALGPVRSAGETTLSMVITTVTILREPVIRLLSLFGGVSKLIQPRHAITLNHPPVNLPPVDIQLPRHIPRRGVHHAARVGGRGSGAGRWLAPVEAIALWGTLLLGLLTPVRVYLRRHPEWRHGSRLLEALATICSCPWSWLRERLHRYRRSLAERVPAVRALRRPLTNLARGRLLGVQAPVRSPAERAIRYYLNTVRQADRQGFARRREGDLGVGAVGIRTGTAIVFSK